MIEQRMMKRFRLELPASVSVQGEDGDQATIDFLTTDISGSGAFFQTDYPLPIASKVNIELILPLDDTKKTERRGSLIKVSGKVIRTNQRGMAICFNANYKILPLERRC